MNKKINPDSSIQSYRNLLVIYFFLTVTCMAWQRIHIDYCGLYLIVVDAFSK